MKRWLSEARRRAGGTYYQEFSLKENMPLGLSDRTDAHSAQQAGDMAQYLWIYTLDVTKPKVVCVRSTHCSPWPLNLLV